MSIVFNFGLNILIIVFILGLLVFIHELGHFVIAKLSGMYVEAFALGMGPKVFGRKIGETEYMINLFPIGGYVKILGEEDFGDDENVSENPRSFQNKSTLARAGVLIAGVSMNFLLAVAVYYFLLVKVSFTWALDPSIGSFDPWFGDKQREIISNVKYDGLIEDGNAEEAEIPDKGWIAEINGKEIELSSQVSELISPAAGSEVEMSICKEKELEECEVYKIDVSDEGFIGIRVFQNYIYKVEYKGAEKVFGGFVHSFNQIKVFGFYFSKLFSDAAETGNYEGVVNSVSSPIGLYFIVDQLKESGVIALLDLVASLSLTLAIFNSFPVPALDGGRVVLLGLEKLLGELFSKKIEAILIQFSFVLLIIFMLVILFKDVIFFDSLKSMFG